MSQENVEIFRQALDAFNRRDKAAWMAECDPELENVPPADWPEFEPLRGREAVWEFWIAGNEPWGLVAYESSELLAVENNTIVTRLQSEMEGTASGARVTWSFWLVARFRKAKLVRIEWFDNRAEALEALGLSEWENAEQRGLAEAGFGALNSGDLEAFLALTTEDVEFTSMVAEAEGTTFRGHDGVRAWWDTVRGVFEDVRWDLLDIRGSGNRGVLHFRMTGTLGGVPVEQTMWQATALRDGKVIWWAFFRSEREALEAVGLRG
jgi:ketosteroid isomerase-like protein